MYVQPVKFEVNVKGMEEVKELVRNHAELVEAMEKNLRELNAAVVEINVKINQPQAEAND